MSYDLLKSEKFIADQVAVFHGRPWKGPVNDYAIQTALQMQALTLMDKLSDIMIRSVVISEVVKNQKALHFLRYGAARRLRMIWYAYRNLIFNAPPDRDDPLNSDESNELTESLNIIYLNIRGVVDNLCWSLLHEFAPEKAVLKPSKIGLFLPCITEDERFSDLAGVIKSHDSWDRDLKLRRDPAAHQIPLSIPPQALTPSEAKTYNNLIQEYWSLTLSRDYNRADEVLSTIDKVGRFIPYFVHDPDKPIIPIYPVVSDDVAHLVALFEAIDKFFMSYLGLEE